MNPNEAVAATAAECLNCETCHPQTPAEELAGPCEYVAGLLAGFVAAAPLELVLLLPGYAAEATHQEGGSYFHRFATAEELVAELNTYREALKGT